MATDRCRSMIVNTTVIGRTCFDGLQDEDSAAEIIQSCITDVQVDLHIPGATETQNLRSLPRDAMRMGAVFAVVRCLSV